MRRHLGDEGERGATLVEFALIAPILFMILFSLFDIGLAVIGSSVATNSAREGARVGIINYVDADNPVTPDGFANYSAIKAAADDKLVGLIKPDTSSGSSVVVKCYDGDKNGSGVHPQKSCAKASIEVDKDLIEVTVKWKSISPNRIWTASAYTSVARMVITGGLPSDPIVCGAPPSLQWAPPSYATDEQNSNHTIPITVTRTGNLNCPTSVPYSTGGGTATAGSAGCGPPCDYEQVVAAPIFFAPGEDEWTGTITIVGDDIKETPANETFNLIMNTALVTNGTIATPSAPVTITDLDLDTDPPGLTFTLRDNDTDGKIDRLVGTANEDLQNSCPTPATKITFPTNGPGVSLAAANTVTFSGAGNRTVTVLLNEGAGTGPPAVDTSNLNLGVSLAAGCIRDLDNNSLTFTDQHPNDGASPIPVSVSDTNGTADGTLQSGDSLEFTFSEPMDSGSIASSTDVVVLGGTGNGNADRLRATALFNGDPSLGAGNYISQMNSTATFVGSSIAFNGTKVTLTLSNTCTGSCGNLTQGNSTNMTFAFVTGLTGNGAVLAQPSITTTTARRWF